jgi:hypothetical protein
VNVAEALGEGSNPVATQAYIQNADCQSKISCAVRDTTIRSPKASSATLHSDVHRASVTFSNQFVLPDGKLFERKICSVYGRMSVSSRAAKVERCKARAGGRFFRVMTDEHSSIRELDMRLLRACIDGRTQRRKDKEAKANEDRGQLVLI